MAIEKSMNPAFNPLPISVYGKEYGVKLKEVGDDSLEILLDWYEKNFIRPSPNKLQIKRLSSLANLSKSEVRNWTSQVRKVNYTV